MELSSVHCLAVQRRELLCGHEPMVEGGEEMNNNGKEDNDFGTSINNLWELYGNAILKRDEALSDLGWVTALCWRTTEKTGKRFRE